MWGRYSLGRAERPPSPDTITLRAFTNNLGEQRYVVEGRFSGCHCGDKVFKTHPDAVAFGRMEANWHGAKFVDEARG